MKAKYKLGNLVQYKIDSSQDTGTINGIVTRKEGFSYFVTGNETGEVMENDVIAAYKEVKTRTVKATRSSSKKKSTKESQLTQ